jgi:Na+/melibiose symporter-like transporter
VTALVGTAAAMALATALFGDGHVFATGNVTPLLVGNVLAGVVASALWVLPGSMMADVADQDELATGQRREGLFFGLINFGEKIASGAALLVAGLLLDFFVDLVPGTAQNPGAASRIGLSYGVLPALMLGGAAASIAGYGLDRQRMLAIQGELQRRSALPLTADRDLRDAVGARTGG